jgi:hypothetical protein
MLRQNFTLNDERASASNTKVHTSTNVPECSEKNRSNKHWYIYLTIGIVIGTVVNSTFSYNNSKSAQIVVLGQEPILKKRPLQIFPLLKELNSGWKNLQVRTSMLVMKIYTFWDCPCSYSCIFTFASIEQS